MEESIFKAYDIRGVYPKEINEDTVEKIGHAIIDVLDMKTVAIGRDARASSPSLYAALEKGITDAGGTVINLGLLTTPMVYYASGTLPVDGALSVTASHNPPQYNGIKIARAGAVPVGGENGLMDIKEYVLHGTPTIAPQKGTVQKQNIIENYYAHFAQYAAFGDRRFTVVIDTANAMGILETPLFERFAKNIMLVKMYDDLSHPFTAHEPNPLKTETLAELQKKVTETKADMGISYDGDADRVGFVDENGTVIPMDLITGLIARILLKKHRGATILYDLRSSRAVKEVIEENGGIAHECRVGHALIKKQMRDESALFAGELSGHYYFQENFGAEAGTLAAFYLLNLMAETGKPISALVKDLRRYHHSGEINSDVENKNAVMQKLKETYADGALSERDGVKIDYADWWFNVRPSNTESVLRLNVEAGAKEMMEQKRDELLCLIRA